MKYVEVMIAAKVDYKKHMRVVAKLNKTEYFLGTVTRRSKDNKIYVAFDNGDKVIFSINSKKLMGEGISRTRKTAITEKDLSKFLKNKTAIIKPVVKKPTSKIPDVKLEHWTSQELKMWYKLPPERDLFAVHFKHREGGFAVSPEKTNEDYEDIREELRFSCHNGANIPMIKKMSIKTMKQIIDCFISLGMFEEVHRTYKQKNNKNEWYEIPVISYNTKPECGLKIRELFSNNLVALEEESKEYRDAVAESYRPGVYNGD